MNKKIAFLGTLLLVGNSIAIAQDNPWYAGGRIGATLDRDVDFNGATGLKDNKDIGAGVFLGYNINDWFGLETGYTYLGKMEVDDNSSFKTNAFEIVGKFTDEVTDSLDIFVKAGAFAYKAKGSGSLSDYSDTDVDGTFGVGLEQHFTDNLSARIEYQYYNNVTLNDDPNDAKWDTHLVALGLIYSWGGHEAMEVTEAPMTKVEEVVEEKMVEEVVVAPVVKKAIEVEPQTVEVYFDFNKENLTQRSISDLQPLIAHLQQYPKAKVVLVGHADSVGPAESNQKLSEKRAETVASYLQDEYSISADRIMQSGNGEANPIASNETKAGRAKNRRVSVFSPSFVMEEM